MVYGSDPFVKDAHTFAAGLVFISFFFVVFLWLAVFWIAFIWQDRWGLALHR
jgi:diacylglycerol kinase